MRRTAFPVLVAALTLPLAVPTAAASCEPGDCAKAALVFGSKAAFATFQLAANETRAALGLYGEAVDATFTGMSCATFAATGGDPLLVAACAGTASDAVVSAVILFNGTAEEEAFTWGERTLGAASELASAFLP